MSLSTLDLEALPDRSVVATPAGSIAQLVVQHVGKVEVRRWLVPGHGGVYPSQVVSTWGVTLLRRGAGIAPSCGCARCDGERRAQLPWPASICARMSLCPDCGSKRCPRAAFHGNSCAVRDGLTAEPSGPEPTSDDGDVIAFAHGFEAVADYERAPSDKPARCELDYPHTHWGKPCPAASCTPEAQR
jgi:hypothetical protein